MNNNNTIEEIIVSEFNQHYKEKFKNIRNVVNEINKVKGWSNRINILKKFLKTLPKTEFTLLEGKYKGKFLVYYTISNRFSIREVKFSLKDSYTFVNGKYTLIDFKNNILNGTDIFNEENIYLILELQKLEDEFTCYEKFTGANVKEELIKIEDEDLIFEEDGFIINEDDEVIILDEDLSEQEIEEILRNIK